MSNISNNMSGQAIIIEQQSNDQLGEIIVSTTIDQSGEIKTIGNGNKTYGQVEVIQPPLTNKIINPKYDAYVRSDYPTFSYDSSSSLYTGKLGNADSKTFIYFDLSSFASSIVIKNAIMRLYCINIDTAANISLYSINKAFIENSTTWDNAPSEVNFITSKSINAKDNYVDIDLSNYFNTTFKDKSDNGICIKLNNISDQAKGFYSKEAEETLKPTLSLQYYDINDLVEVNEMYGEILVNQRIKNETPAEITVKTTYFKDKNDIAGEMNISKPIIDGEIKVLSKSDVNGEMNVSIFGVNDKNSEITVTKPIIDGEINVVNKITTSSLLDGNIDIIKYKSTKNENLGEIIVSQHKNIYMLGEITTLSSKNGESIQEGNILLSKPEQLGEITISDHINTYKDNNGEINIAIKTVSDNTGEITVANCNDTTGEIIVNQRISNDNIGEISIYNIQNNNNFGEITVANCNDTIGEIIVNQRISNDNIGEISIYNIENNDKTGEVTIVSNLTKNNDKLGEIKLISPNEKIGEITVAPDTEINGEIAINTKTANEIDGELTVTIDIFRGYTQIIYY